MGPDPKEENQCVSIHADPDPDTPHCAYLNKNYIKIGRQSKHFESSVRRYKHNISLEYKEKHELKKIAAALKTLLGLATVPQKTKNTESLRISVAFL
jgi:hypothetical protein